MKNPRKPITNIVEGGATHHDRERHIAAAAYFRAEERGFAPGYELDDWLEAERELDEEGVS